MCLTWSQIPKTGFLNFLQAEVNGEILSDMILHDLLRDTAEELESLEEEESARRDAVTMHHSPTLENMYQRLEQMEVR